MPGLVYDTGALLAAERGDRALLALHLQAIRLGVRPVVPSVVLAQAWRGGPQPLLSRLLKGCHVLDVGEPLARAVGTACARSATVDVVDALVVVVASTLDAVVLTSDPNDLECIASAVQVDLTVRTV